LVTSNLLRVIGCALLDFDDQWRECGCQDCDPGSELVIAGSIILDRRSI
jgi:hypothetical protein